MRVVDDNPDSLLVRDRFEPAGNRGNLLTSRGENRSPLDREIWNRRERRERGNQVRKVVGPTKAEVVRSAPLGFLQFKPDGIHRDARVHSNDIRLVFQFQIGSVCEHWGGKLVCPAKPNRVRDVQDGHRLLLGLVRKLLEQAKLRGLVGRHVAVVVQMILSQIRENGNVELKAVYASLVQRMAGNFHRNGFNPGGASFGKKVVELDAKRSRVVQFSDHRRFVRGG